ncbi:MOSC domain-containing protein [Haloplanus aerogenes]|uniref:MOSC domain-containing protein n=1 Tax=Haloplanus aerogenes TaxID=660522 RepID=A0A3M0DQF5_9EURY|nr:MOSC domain-containing protein [Haloplanus aerogenes]AZH24551.1 MOSC domain-containing protein [Haloplanus aerogenes]RMB23794.1 MOSC domain-containing protein [Haloplanus aerogenes]
MERVTNIFVADAGSEPMQSVDRVAAVEGGLRGDRYCEGRGHYTPFDVCEVTLIASEDIAAIDAELGLSLSAGQHRRNLVTEGVDLHDLLDHRFRVGGATLTGTRPRPPCSHVEQLAEQEGVARALGKGRGGICADVIDPGRIGVGDEVVDLGSTDRTDDIVARLRSED